MIWQPHGVSDEMLAEAFSETETSKTVKPTFWRRTAP
jgi:hypothetical protein